MTKKESFVAPAPDGGYITECPLCDRGIVHVTFSAVLLLWIAHGWQSFRAHRRALRELKEEASGE